MAGMHPAPARALFMGQFWGGAVWVLGWVPAAGTRGSAPGSRWCLLGCLPLGWTHSLQGDRTWGMTDALGHPGQVPFSC